MLSLNSPLVIDTEHAVKSIENSIRRLLDSHSAEGVIIGLSGGIDSAVLTTLAMRALGTEAVHTYHLYDRDSEKRSRRNALLMADWLGLELKLHNISPAMHEKRLYSPLIMRLTAVSGFVNRHLNARLHRLFHGELPFVSTLRGPSLRVGKIKRFFYKNTVGCVEAAFSARHIYRRSFLEERAADVNRLVLGAANHSECMVGWFVKDGIDDMPFSPIAGLYKTQVCELARYLELPGRIRNQPPSPDMVKGITDEHAMGISYAKLDIILHGLDKNLSDAEITAFGVSLSQIRHVRRLHELSAWKRTA
ncbi:MAG: NAD(+) synthase [Planctomycetota bacterium]